jgi:methionyl-tRNA synthetase
MANEGKKLTKTTKSTEKVSKSSGKKSNKPHKIVVTSALPYANGSIHLGHLVEYIQTDIFVRFLKLIGKDAIYCCADDTHGTPIELKAKQLGIKPEKLIEQIWKEHTKDFSDFHIEFDSYYSTNSKENKEYAEFIYNELRKKDLIYTKAMQLVYCEHCKRFLPDRFVKGTCPECKAEDQYGDVCEKCGNAHKTTDLINPKCTICNGKPIEKESKHYFFKLSKCKKQLTKFLQKKTLQKEVVNFCMNWIEKLEDWCISRDAPYFGFEIPNSVKETGSTKYFYVWLDAPVGYISSTANYCKNIAKGKGKDGKALNEKDYWMPKNKEESEIIHVIGKDIIYFHYLFWPAMLENSGIKQPDQIMTHGFLTVGKEKMSKTRGTFVSARHYLNYLNPQYLRFYYAANLTAKMEDIDLDIADFKTRINTELIGNLGNFGYRTISFLNKNFDNKIEEFDVEDKEVQKIINEFTETAVKIRNNYRHFEFREVIKDILHLSSLGNKYFQDKEPWALLKGTKEEKEQAHKVLSFCFHLLKNLGIIISPIMPKFAEKLQKQLNLKNLTWDDIHFDMKSHKINKGEILVNKIEDEIKKMIQDNAPKDSKKDNKSGENTSNEFLLDLRVAKIESVEDHPDADRLYVIKIDLGKEKRQLVAGIKKYYSKEDLEGKKVVVITNLEPVKLKGVKSEGMMLAAEKKKDVVVLEADKSKVGDQVYIDGIKLVDKFNTIKFDDFLKYKMKVKDKKVFLVGNEDDGKESKFLRTKKEEIKASINDNAKVC